MRWRQIVCGLCSSLARSRVSLSGSRQHSHASPARGDMLCAEGRVRQASLPGTPTDLTSYIDCFVCGSHTAQVGESNRHKCIPTDQLKCTGCGLTLPDHDEYKIHALTFCRMGPTSQGRCGCCNVNGPQCLCQQHWRKTYNLVVSVLQNSFSQPRAAGRDSGHPASKTDDHDAEDPEPMTR